MASIGGVSRLESMWEDERGQKVPWGEGEGVSEGPILGGGEEQTSPGSQKPFSWENPLHCAVFDAFVIIIIAVI